jgi:hypothetical protein
LAEFLMPSPDSLLTGQDQVPNSEETELLSELPKAVGGIPGLAENNRGRYRYGYIGLGDKRMKPILRPGSIVLVDTSIRRIEDAEWRSEYERPMYFVELRGGYRCGWFQKIKSQLIMQPHALSRCAQESWRMPEEAELVGKSYWHSYVF